jgi:hypothetical protein
VGGHHDFVDFHDATGPVVGHTRDGVDAVVQVDAERRDLIIVRDPDDDFYSFRSRLRVSPGLTRTYLRCPVLWPVLGKQFLVLGVKTV